MVARLLNDSGVRLLSMRSNNIRLPIQAFAMTVMDLIVGWWRR